MPVTRRKFLGGMVAGASALAMIAGVDTLLVEPQTVVAERLDAYLKRLPEEFDGFRIAQLSDIHFGPYMGKTGVQRAVRLAESFRPDLVVVTGDFVSHPLHRRNGPEGARYAEPCADALVTIKDTRIMAVLGNHDHWNQPRTIAGSLRSRGIEVLNNRAVPVERGKARIWISGVDDAYVRAADLVEAIADVPPTETNLLLAHEPDFADYAARFPIDLQLSGHSHGGQVRLPGIGALILPTMGRKYSIGLNRVGPLQVYTNRGLGVINPPVRFHCPPEVTLVTLRLAPHV
jgi:predicted MPP superfamily phosphohydrolase